MICRTCLRRATGLLFRPPIAPRVFSTTLAARNASAAAPTTSTAPPGLTPIETPGEAAEAAAAATAAAEGKAALSGCPAGTVLNGLSYIKGKPDLVAKPDDEYPEWLWRCLEVTKKSSQQGDASAGDEFCTFVFACCPPFFDPAQSLCVFSFPPFLFLCLQSRVWRVKPPS
jgi:large subunit ribosomal protein L54